MGKFGRKTRDTLYIVTLKSGDVINISASKLVQIKTDDGEHLWYFHSTQFSNEQAVVINDDEILTVENDGKVVAWGAYLVGILGGGAAGGVMYVLMKGILGCAIKNPILRKGLIAFTIAGVCYITATTVASVMADESMEFWDATKFCAKRAKESVEKAIDGIKNAKEDKE